MPKNYKEMIDEIINKIDEEREVEEDAPANSAGGGAIAGIGVGPDGEPGITRRSANKYKKKNKEDQKKIKDNIKENNDNNNVVLKQILDGLDKADLAIDKMNGDVEVELQPIEERKSIKERFKIRWKNLKSF